MACHCHGADGRSVKHASPFDQCTTCAKKHIVKAWSLFNEFCYEDDNRDSISGQLRLAVDHLKDDHRELALAVRDLAVMIEENRDAEIADEWDKILSAVRMAFCEEHPEIAAKLEELRHA